MSNNEQQALILDLTDRQTAILNNLAMARSNGDNNTAALLESALHSTDEGLKAAMAGDLDTARSSVTNSVSPIQPIVPNSSTAQWNSYLAQNQAILPPGTVADLQARFANAVRGTTSMLAQKNQAYQKALLDALTRAQEIFHDQVVDDRAIHYLTPEGYTGVQVEVSINDQVLFSTQGFAYTIEQPILPIYGWNSEFFDMLSPGQVSIGGALVLNLSRLGMMERLLRGAKTQFQPPPLSVMRLTPVAGAAGITDDFERLRRLRAQTWEDHMRQQQIVTRSSPASKISTNPSFTSPQIDPPSGWNANRSWKVLGPFALRMNIGTVVDRTTAEYQSASAIIINECYVTGLSVRAFADDEVVGEVYNFLGKDQTYERA